MKVDGGITFDLSQSGQSAREAEAAGYDGVWAAETSHDPFLNLLLAAEATERIELGTGMGVPFADGWVRAEVTCPGGSGEWRVDVVGSG